MLLLSWLGTLLFVDTAQGGVVHGPVWPETPGWVQLRLPMEAPPAESAPSGLPGVAIEPGAVTGLVHIVHGAADLWPEPHGTATLFRPRAGQRPNFLMIGQTAGDDLRLLLSQAWSIGGRGAVARIRLSEHFVLLADSVAVDLLRDWPRRVPRDDGSIAWALLTDQGPVMLEPAQGAPDAAPHLRPRSPLRAPTRRDSLAALHAAAEGRVKLAYPEEFVHLPLTVCDADRDWLYGAGGTQINPFQGRQNFAPCLCRARDQFVALGRHLEGIVFDAHGIANEAGYVHEFAARPGDPMYGPAGVAGRDGQVFARANLLHAAPRVSAPHAVFYSAHLTNYAHWLIDSLAPLFVMRPHLPPGTHLLLPGTLRGLQALPHPVIDHYKTLAVCGFGDMPVREIDAPFCRAEDIFWLDTFEIGWMPAAALQAFRAHILALCPPPARRGRKLYVTRPRNRRVANDAQLWAFLEKHAFERVSLETMRFEEQIALFAGAEWVVGVHGAELANLLFCAPGTRVLELGPEDRFRPYFSQLSSKLALTHAVLPAALQGQDFFGDVMVDVPKFAALFRMLKHRL